MSDFCSKFAAEKNTIMEKRTYIQPKCEVVAVATSAMMDGNPLSGGSFPGGLPLNPAPTWRPKNPTRTPVF